MVAKKKAAPKKAVVKAKGGKTTMPANSDITISVSVKTPDGSVDAQDVVIKSAGGCIPLAYLNNPHRIHQSIREGLRDRYGANHVKV